MLKISILKVESPACIWGRVEGGPGDNAQTMGQYDHLTAQMNLFYHDVTQDQHKLKHTNLDKGQICAAFSPALKCWCRAKIEAVITDSVSCQVRCFLVDCGQQLVVPSDQVRVAMPDFLLLPFWVQRFHLSGVKPIRLLVSVNEEKAKMIPSSHWDSSSTLYLHKLLQASSQTEAVLHETEEDSISIQLFLMFGSIKVCANDELVAKKFAYYSKDPAAGGGLDDEDRKPAMLSSSILNHVVNYRKPLSKSLPHSPPPAAALYLGTAEICNWMTNGCEPQIPQVEFSVTEKDTHSDVTAENQLPDIQSSSSSEACAAESDCTEETDSSLAAALTKNISLFKFLKFLNPQSIFNQTASIFNRENKPDGPEGTAATDNCTPPIEPTTANDEQSVNGSDDCLLELKLQQLSNEPKSSEASSLCESEAPEKERSWRSEDHWACSRLLEWLNPEPLKADDSEDVEVAPALDPQKDLHLVHSVFPLEPCQSLDDTPITDQLRRLIQRKQLYSLSPADRYSWPAVARGCNTLIVSPNAEQPISYLPPLLTHVLQNSIYSSLTSSTGPIVVVVCPGWQKAQAIFDLLEETKVSNSLHPMIINVGVKKDEAKSVKIPKNCLLIVTTPFSFVRVLSHHCFLFMRMYHLVLDEADQLFTLASEQMTTILQHFQKVVSSEDKAACPQQIVAASKQWTSQMEELLTSHMPHPSIIITIPEEAALYANLQQIILMSLESSKINVLLGTLDFTPDVGQKTLIITSSPREADDVFEAVRNKSAFCMKSHEGLTHEFDFVVQQWKKSIGPGTHVVLVTTNECLKCLGILDATCVVHYGFPASPRKFGSRLFSMVKNFRNLTKPGSQDKVDTGRHLARSVLLISERNARHVVGVLRYLGRTGAPLPPKLLSFAQSITAAREDQKTNKPLCSHLKSFGACRDSSVCPDRHSWNPHLDKSELPASGVIEVVPLFIKTASVFYGRIVTKEENDFGSLAAAMTLFYADKKPGATEVLAGALYAVQEEKDFHRVKVLSIPDRGDRLFFSVFVQFIDVGKREEVKAHQLLQLPEQFQSVPGQAVEIIVCRVKPADSERDWHPKVTRAISQKIKGLQHRVRVVLTLGNTVFADPMVRVTQVPGMKTMINEYSLQSEILSSGMAESNPEHINLLKALCHADSTASSNKLSVSSNPVISLENRIQAEEEALTQAFRAAEVRNLTAAADRPQLELLCPASIINKPPLVTLPPSLLPLPLILLRQKLLDRPQEKHRNKTDLRRSCESLELLASNDSSLQTSPVKQNGVTEEHEMARNEVLNAISTQVNGENNNKSLHPSVRWYQSTDSLTVTLKLSNPEAPSCQFSSDRVVFRSVGSRPLMLPHSQHGTRWSTFTRAFYTGGSGYMFGTSRMFVSFLGHWGRVDSKWYEANLELHRNIDTDRCSWKLKSNEPVLTLLKETPTCWEKLVKAKNIFVSYDLDHFEEDDDRMCNGQSFVEDIGEHNFYVNSETDSDSD